MTRGVIAVLVGTAAAAGGAMLWIPANDGTGRWWDPTTIELVHPWRGDLWWNGPWGEVPTATVQSVTTVWGSQAIVVARGDPVGSWSVAAPADVPSGTPPPGAAQPLDRDDLTADAKAAPAHETIRFGTVGVSIARFEPRQVILPLLVLELLSILAGGLGLALWLHRRARQRAASGPPVLA